METGWDRGRVFTTGTYQGNHTADTNKLIEKKFLDFLRGFRLEAVYPYRHYPFN